MEQDISFLLCVGLTLHWGTVFAPLDLLYYWEYVLFRALFNHWCSLVWLSKAAINACYVNLLIGALKLCENSFSINAIFLWTFFFPPDHYSLALWCHLRNLHKIAMWYGTAPPLRNSQQENHIGFTHLQYVKLCTRLCSYSYMRP